MYVHALQWVYITDIPVINTNVLACIDLPSCRRVIFVLQQEWGRLLSSLYWNYSGFDAAGAYAGEIQSPKTTYPKAMVLTVVMIAFT